MTYPIEMFLDDHYRVVRSAEEQKAIEADGWSTVRPANHKYMPWSARIAKAPWETKPEPATIAAFQKLADESVEEVKKRGPGRPPKVQE